MGIPVFGDIHRRWGTVQRILDREAGERGSGLAVGDFGNFKYGGSQKLVFVHGNHESFGHLKEIRYDKESNLAPIFSGEVVIVEGLRVAGLPGVYSPKVFEGGDKPLKYYNRSDIEQVAALTDIDILLTHEAPAGIFQDDLGLGRREIMELVERLQPRMAFCGHHHSRFETTIGQTRMIALDYPHRSYVVIDPSTSGLRREVAELVDKRYTYPWEAGC